MNKLTTQWALIFLLVAFVLIAEFISKYWNIIIFAVSLIVFLVVCWLILDAWRRKQDRMCQQQLKVELEAITREKIAASRILRRYDWSDDARILARQWEEYEAIGKTPIKKRTLRRKAGKNRLQSDVNSAEIKRIHDAIRKSAKLQRYDWSSDPDELKRQWQIYETAGLTPIRRSTAERRGGGSESVK